MMFVLGLVIGACIGAITMGMVMSNHVEEEERE